MIRVIRIFAWIAPCDMHLTHGQINHQCVDGFLAVKGIEPFDVVIADRVRDVDMVLLNGLQTLDRVFIVLA